MTMMFLIVAASSAKAQDRSEKGFYFTVGAGINWATMGAWGSDMPADPGFALNGSIGYDFNKWIGAELNSGYLYNSGTYQDTPLHQVPVILNALVHFPPHSKFDPYLGLGLGGNVEHSKHTILDPEEGYLLVGTTGGDAAFQFTAGMNYYIREKIAVGAHYRYIWLFAASVIGLHDNGNNSLVLDLKYRF
jgi:opacity protein-like surface antigen